MDYIMVRDKWSYNLLERNSIKSSKANDLCFAPQKFLPFEIKEKQATKKIERITFILRDWPHSNDNIHIKRAIRFIKKHKKNRSYKFQKVVLFANDLNCEKQLIKENIDYVKWNPNKFSIQKFMDIIYDTDLVISSRYHGIVLSSIFKIPFIPIEVDPKLQLFTEGVYNQKIGWKYPYKDIGLRNQIERLTKTSIEHIAYSETKIKDYRQLINIVLQDVNSILNEKNKD